MNKSKYTTTRFEIDGKFFVEVYPNGDKINFDLSAEGVGFKINMFAIDKKKCPEKHWEEIIETHIDEYLEMFIEDFGEALEEE